MEVTRKPEAQNGPERFPYHLRRRVHLRQVEAPVALGELSAQCADSADSIACSRVPERLVRDLKDWVDRANPLDPFDDEDNVWPPP